MKHPLHSKKLPVLSHLHSQIYDLKDHSYRSKLKKQGIHKASCLTEIQRNAARQRIQDPYPFPVKAVQHQM